MEDHIHPPRNTVKSHKALPRAWLFPVKLLVQMEKEILSFDWKYVLCLELSSGRLSLSLFFFNPPGRAKGWETTLGYREWLLFNFGFSIRIAFWGCEQDLLLDKWDPKFMRLGKWGIPGISNLPKQGQQDFPSGIKVLPMPGWSRRKSPGIFWSL